MPGQPAPVIREDPPPDGFPGAAAPPSPPAEITDPGPEGAKAAARYWFRTLNWATWSNDAGPFADASSVACEVCRQMHTMIVERANAGMRVDGGMYRVDDVKLRQVVAEDAVLVDVPLTVQSAGVVAADAPEQPPAGTHQVTFVLGMGYTNGNWVVVTVGELPSSG